MAAARYLVALFGHKRVFKSLFKRARIERDEGEEDRPSDSQAVSGRAFRNEERFKCQTATRVIHMSSSQCGISAISAICSGKLANWATRFRSPSARAEANNFQLTFASLRFSSRVQNPPQFCGKLERDEHKHNLLLCSSRGTEIVCRARNCLPT